MLGSRFMDWELKHLGHESLLGFIRKINTSKYKKWAPKSVFRMSFLNTTSDAVLAKKIKTFAFTFLVEDQFSSVSGGHSRVTAKSRLEVQSPGGKRSSNASYNVVVTKSLDLAHSTDFPGFVSVKLFSLSGASTTHFFKLHTPEFNLSRVTLCYSTSPFPCAFLHQCMNKVFYTLTANFC